MLTALAILVVIAIAAYVVWHHIIAERELSKLVLQGNVDIRQVELGFRVAGRLSEMRFEEGDRVKTGDVLAVLDPVPFTLEVQAAEAQVSQTQANLIKLQHGNRPQEIAQGAAQLAEQKATLENTQRLLARESSLLKASAVSKQEYENAVARAREADARVNAAGENLRLLRAGSRQEDIAAGIASLGMAQARLATAKNNLADTKILSPSDGTIFTRVYEPGAIIQQSMPVYALSLHDPVWVRAYIEEPDLGRIKPGMKANVETDRKGSATLTGTIGFISPQAEFTPKNVETRALRTDLVYRVRVLVNDPQGDLRQGMPVTVTIPTTEGSVARKTSD